MFDVICGFSIMTGATLMACEIVYDIARGHEPPRNT